MSEEDYDDDIRTAIEARLRDQDVQKSEIEDVGTLIREYQSKFKPNETCSIIIHRRHVLKSTLRLLYTVDRY